MEVSRKTESLRETNKGRSIYENLLTNFTVEVRSSEDALLGSWHPAKIINCERNRCLVRYDHLLADDELEYLSEYVDFCSSGVGPGLESSSNFRGKLRPTPPKFDCSMHFVNSMCVDAYYKDAWWEGVAIDSQDDGKWKIFFPDQGDEMSISTDYLRLTYDWNEATGQWSIRGKWLLMQIIEELQPYADYVSIEQVWFDLRQIQKFQQDMEWTSQEKSVWKELILEVINKYREITANEFLSSKNLLQDLVICDSESEDVPAAILDHPDSSGLMMTQAGVDVYERSDHSHDSGLQSRKRPLFSPSLIKPAGKLASSPNGVDPAEIAESVVSRYCPEVITEYIQSWDGVIETDNKKKRELVTRVRQHLSAIGWRLWYKPKGQRLEARYDSPEKKTYISLLTACRAVPISGPLQGFSKEA